LYNQDARQSARTVADTSFSKPERPNAAVPPNKHRSVDLFPSLKPYDYHEKGENYQPHFRF